MRNRALQRGGSVASPRESAGPWLPTLNHCAIDHLWASVYPSVRIWLMCKFCKSVPLGYKQPIIGQLPFSIYLSSRNCRKTARSYQGHTLAFRTQERRGKEMASLWSGRDSSRGEGRATLKLLHKTVKHNGKKQRGLRGKGRLTL